MGSVVLRLVVVDKLAFFAIILLLIIARAIPKPIEATDRDFIASLPVDSKRDPFWRLFIATTFAAPLVSGW